jgi:hypothetical protein
LRWSSLALLGVVMCGRSREALDEGHPSGTGGVPAGEVARALASPPISHVYNHGPAKLEARVVAAGDTAWIHAYVDCCHQAGAIVRWDASQGPLDVELFDPQGQPLAWGAAGDIVQRQPGEVRLLRGAHGGSFLVRVRASGRTPVTYSTEVYAPVFVR